MLYYIVLYCLSRNERVRLVVHESNEQRAKDAALDWVEPNHYRVEKCVRIDDTVDVTEI